MEQVFTGKTGRMSALFQGERCENETSGNDRKDDDRRKGGAS